MNQSPANRVAPTPDVDRMLATRGLRHHTLGPTGARVFCRHLDNALGMRGRFCFLHDRDDAVLTDPIILRLTVNDEPVPAPRASCMWYPSHARRQTTEAGLSITESKFITWDDVICDVVALTNMAAAPLTVRLEAETGAPHEQTRAGRDTISGVGLLLGERARLLLGMPTTRGVPAETLVCDVTLQPGDSTSLLIALAVGLRQGEAQAALKRWASDPDPLARQERETQKWFADHCPSFECPCARFNRIWWYRWFLLRHNLVWLTSEEGEGTAFHEAREGEHTRLGFAGASWVLQEARWLREARFVHDHIYWLMAADPGVPTREFLPAAMWQALQVWPDPRLAAQVGQWALRHLAAVRERCDPDNNLLLAGGVGPLGPDADEGEEALERVDHSAMFAASLQATAELLALARRDVDARWHAGMAERGRAALLERCWDSWDHCFYDVQGDTGEPVRVPRAAGFAPFAFGLVPDEAEYARALALLVDGDHFWGEHPLRLESRAAGEPPLASHPGVPPPASSAGGSPARRDRHPGASSALQMGQLALPPTNSLIAEAMAVAARSHTQPHVTARKLMDFLWLIAGLQTDEGDEGRPLTRLAYDSTTGEGYGALDCLQSSFNDLLIRHVCGVTPRPDGTLEVAPLCVGWDWFALRDVPVRGHRVSVIWDTRPDHQRPAQVPPGLSVYVDGDRVAESPQLERLTVPLA